LWLRVDEKELMTIFMSLGFIYDRQITPNFILGAIYVLSKMPSSFS